MRRVSTRSRLAALEVAGFPRFLDPGAALQLRTRLTGLDGPGAALDALLLADPRRRVALLESLRARLTALGGLLARLESPLGALHLLRPGLRPLLADLLPLGALAAAARRFCLRLLVRLAPAALGLRRGGQGHGGHGGDQEIVFHRSNSW
jgi:hypothetical protein